MALHRSSCLARTAVQGAYGAIQRPSLLQTAATPTLCIAHQLLREKRQRNRFTTSSRHHAEDLEMVRAAPEIDFKNFNIQPARIVPASPAYFSGSPKFIDHRIKLERLLEKYALLPTLPAGEAPRMAWFKLAQFRDLLDEPIPAKKYKNFQKVLQRLNRIKPELLPEEVRGALHSYVRPGNPYANKPTPSVVDEFGRARGKGKRKESSAVAFLVEGDGQVLVNDKNIIDAFPRVHDRESALWALRCTQRLDKYNVWAKVSGGGVTGQAEAITLAVARALMVHEPALKPVLRQGKCLCLSHFTLICLFLRAYTNSCFQLQPVLSQSMPVVSRGRSLVMSKPERCLPGSSDNGLCLEPCQYYHILFLYCIISAIHGDHDVIRPNLCFLLHLVLSLSPPQSS